LSELRRGSVIDSSHFDTLPRITLLVRAPKFCRMKT